MMPNSEYDKLVEAQSREFAHIDKHKRLTELMETLEERTEGAYAALRNFQRAFARLEVEVEVWPGGDADGRCLVWQNHPCELYMREEGSMLRLYVPQFVTEGEDGRTYMTPSQANWACDHLDALLDALIEESTREIERIRSNADGE